MMIGRPTNLPEDDEVRRLRDAFRSAEYAYRVALGQAETAHWPPEWVGFLFSRAAVRDHDGLVTANTIESYDVVADGKTIGRFGRTLGNVPGFYAPSAWHTPTRPDLALFPSKEAAAYAFLVAWDRGQVDAV